jgi:hypothetical protein
MYFMIIVTMITISGVTAPAPVQPSVMDSYVSIEKCRDDLVWMAENDGVKLVTQPMFGKAAVQQYGEEGITVFFCARDMR